MAQLKDFGKFPLRAVRVGRFVPHASLDADDSLVGLDNVNHRMPDRDALDDEWAGAERQAMQNEVETVHAEDFELSALRVARDEPGRTDVHAQGKGITERTELKLAVKAGRESLLKLGADIERCERPGDHQRKDKEECSDDKHAKDEALARSLGHEKMIVGSAEIVTVECGRLGIADLCCKTSPRGDMMCGLARKGFT